MDYIRSACSTARSLRVASNQLMPLFLPIQRAQKMSPSLFHPVYLCVIPLSADLILSDVAHASRKMGSFNYARKPCPRLLDHDFATWAILQDFGMAEPSDRFELRDFISSSKG